MSATEIKAKSEDLPLSWPKITLKDIVEFFSLCSGISFVLSGALEGAVFWIRWRLNYFAIAQPADLIMAAFSVIPTFFISLIFAFFAVFGQRIFVSLYEESRIFRSIDENSFLKTAYRYSKKVSNFLSRIGLLLLILTSLAFMLWAIGVKLPFANKYMPGNASQLAINSKTNILLARSDPQYAECGAAPVLWFGTASAILICHDKLRIAHNSQGMFFDRADPEIDRVPKPKPKVLNHAK